MSGGKINGQKTKAYIQKSKWLYFQKNYEK